MMFPSHISLRTGPSQTNSVLMTAGFQLMSSIKIVIPLASIIKFDLLYKTLLIPFFPHSNHQHAHFSVEITAFCFLFCDDYWRLSNSKYVHYHHRLVWYGITQGFTCLAKPNDVLALSLLELVFFLFVLIMRSSTTVSKGSFAFSIFCLQKS